MSWLLYLLRLTAVLINQSMLFLPEYSPVVKRNIVSYNHIELDTILNRILVCNKAYCLGIGCLQTAAVFSRKFAPLTAQNVCRSPHLKLFNSQQNASLFIKQTVIKMFSLNYYIPACKSLSTLASWTAVQLIGLLWIYGELSPHVLILKPHPRGLAQIQPSPNHLKSHLQAFSELPLFTTTRAVTPENTQLPFKILPSRSSLIINIEPFSPGSE